MFFNNNNDSKIQFLCHPNFLGTLAKPFPSKQYIPDWYKKTPQYVEDKAAIAPMPTIKRCPPFLDSMMVGWIIPLGGTVWIRIEDNGNNVSWESDFGGRDLIQTHKGMQLSNHPEMPRVPLKIMNHWIIKTAPGWSCLFTPPFNRPDPDLDMFTAIVDTDRYDEYINFPGFMRSRENGVVKLEAGRPLLQVIPFKRGSKQEAEIRDLNATEIKAIDTTRQARMANHGLYRDTRWVKKTS